MSDVISRFFIESANIRGQIVQLSHSFQTILSHHDYTPAITSQLGETLAATALLAVPLKTEGSITLQIQSNKNIKLLLAQSTHDFKIRGLAKYAPETTHDECLYEGNIVISLKLGNNESYQGVVAMPESDIAKGITDYFHQSEQLPTFLMLATNATQTAGLLMQRLPTDVENSELWNEDWERIGILASSLTKQELLELPAETILYRLFNQERVRLFDPQPVIFACSCSRERSINAIKLLNEEEALSVFDELPMLTVTCEFCNRKENFDKVDVALIFKT